MLDPKTSNSKGVRYAKSKAYDLPLRIFHWVFAALFMSSFTIGKFLDDDSAIYAYHALRHADGLPDYIKSHLGFDCF